MKAMERIAARSFLVKYVGEMITNEEAEKRVKKYDVKGRTDLEKTTEEERLNLCEDEMIIRNLIVNIRVILQ